jgi:hypothetical protein
VWYTVKGSKIIHVRFPPDDLARLETLCLATAKTPTEVIRALVRKESSTEPSPRPTVPAPEAKPNRGHAPTCPCALCRV